MSNEADGDILILGIGSPFGADCAGWEAVELLRPQGFAGVRLETADRPGTRLLSLLEGARVAILIDALVDDAPTGTLRRLDAGQLAAGDRHSNHGFGVADALALGKVLGALPSRVFLIGIVTDGMTPPPIDAAALTALINGLLQESRESAD